MGLVRESKFLSLVLRHKPETIGITLDENGWADAGLLIKGMAGRFPFDRQMLEEIVRTDSKQRYAFSEDGTKIRANQGHSIQVDVGLVEAVPPDVLYHGTGIKYLEGILADGLKPKSRLYVHLSMDKETARTVGTRHGKPAVFAIDAKRMAAEGFTFYCSANGIWLTEKVPAAYLERMKA